MDRPTPATDRTPDPETAPGLATLLERNRAFAAGSGRDAATPLPFVPRQLAYVITCVDPRLEPGQVLGVGIGDAVVARSIGGRVTAAVVADMAWISYLKETLAPDEPFFDVAVLHHTDCGSALMADDGLRAGFARRTSLDAPAQDALRRLAVTDPAATVRHDVDVLLAETSISPRIRVSGHVYDVATGLVTTVVPLRGRPSP